jgi:NADH:ubiquinone oxidoreductase subunit E
MVAACAVVCAVAVLSADYALARLRAPKDDKLVTALQEQVRADASLAGKLEAEKKRIADALQARKIRVKWLSWMLIASAAAFLTGAKRLRGKDTRAGRLDTRVKARSTHRPAATLSRQTRAPAGQTTGIELAAVDEIIAREGRTREAAIPILQAIQERFRYLPDEALRRVCETTEITPAEISGTSTFYSRFRRSPVGEHIVRVCHGTACHVAGARQITDQLRRGLEIPEGADTDPTRTFTIEEVACLGCCSLAPVLMVDDRTVGKLTPAEACDALG